MLEVRLEVGRNTNLSDQLYVSTHRTKRNHAGAPLGSSACVLPPIESRRTRKSKQCGGAADGGDEPLAAAAAPLSAAEAEAEFAASL